MSAEDFFDKKYPKKYYRDDGWVTSYEIWRKEMIEFAQEYANQEVKKALRMCNCKLPEKRIKVSENGTSAYCEKCSREIKNQ